MHDTTTDPKHVKPFGLEFLEPLQTPSEEVRGEMVMGGSCCVTYYFGEGGPMETCFDWDNPCAEY